MTANPPLPPSFLSLNEASSTPRAFFPVIGVVLSVRDPKETSTGESFFTAVLQSPEKHEARQNGLEVRFFAGSRDSLPKIHGPGDVVVLACVRKDKQGRLFCQRRDTVHVFDESTIPPRALQHAVGPMTNNQLSYTTTPVKRNVSVDVNTYVLYLANWYREEGAVDLGRVAQVGHKAKSSKPHQAHQVHQSRKSALLRDIRAGNYYNVTVQVVKTWHQGSILTLHVTDYTTNPFFYLRQDPDADPYTGEKRWTGPLGQTALEVTLWPPHSYWAQDHGVVADSIIAINNLHVVHSKLDGQIEGKLHEDRAYSNRIDVAILLPRDPRYTQLMHARDHYARQHDTSIEDITSRDAQHIPAKQPMQQESKAERKKKKKKEKARLEAEHIGREQPKDPTGTYGHTGQDVNPIRNPVQSLASILQFTYVQKPELDAHVTYPFLNVRFRAQVRVVDYLPTFLEDFSKSLDDPEYNPEKDYEVSSTMDLDLTSDSKWEWSFWLLVEETEETTGQKPKQLKVLVHGKDAEYLLNMDACDLRTNHQALEKLRSKLFHLWGELEEHKCNGTTDGRKPSSRPFVCCIQEYGVPDGGDSWIRLHRMFETTIKA